jgi:hypothetical protein
MNVRGSIATGFMVLTLGAAAVSASSNAVLPFIADDYPTALAQARAKKLPIFVDVWAPW